MIKTLCKNAVLDLLCFINLEKLREKQADSLLNLKSRFA